MNLKEAFRYQKFLGDMMSSASYYVSSRTNCLMTIKSHYRKKDNPDAEDYEEVVELDCGNYACDDVISFMSWLVDERETLSKAINNAKKSVGFDIDAALEGNKFRHSMNAGIKSMLKYATSKKMETGKGYKFNVEGNQTSYFYEVEVRTEEKYNKDSAKSIVRENSKKADELSAKIELAMRSAVVDYVPAYDVNDPFDDVMDAFLTR